jgi:hypothetical protein
MVIRLINPIVDIDLKNLYATPNGEQIPLQELALLSTRKVPNFLDNEQKNCGWN